MEHWNDGMMVFEESYPYMNNFHFPVKRDVESVIPLFPPKKTSLPWPPACRAYGSESAK
jgi:hypothetical protein